MPGAEKWAADKQRQDARRLGLPPLFIPEADAAWFPRTCGELTQWLFACGAYEGAKNAHTELGTRYVVSVMDGVPGVEASAPAAMYADIRAKAAAYRDFDSSGAYPGVPYLTLVIREVPEIQLTHGVGKAYARYAFEPFDLRGELLLGTMDELFRAYRRDPSRFVGGQKETA